MALLAFSPSSKRIGDFLAGTFVLSERAGTASSITAPHHQVPFQLQSWAVALDLSRLDDQLAMGLRQFVLRAPQLSPPAQHELAEQFRRQLEAVIAPSPPPGVPTPVLLTAVLAERRRRADLASQHDSPQAEQHGWQQRGTAAPHEPLPQNPRPNPRNGFTPPG
jgi:hypothetical protein